MDVAQYDLQSCDGPTVSCGAPFVVIPGSCPADVDHNGDVAVLDLLTVLDEWGACP